VGDINVTDIKQNGLNGQRNIEKKLNELGRINIRQRNIDKTLKELGKINLGLNVNNIVEYLN